MFIESPRFPQCLSFGFTAEPMYLVSIIERASGIETRNRVWSRPLYRYTATVGPRAESDVQDALEFYHVAGGRAHGFRFHDAVDYLSCRVGQTPTATDQPLVYLPNYGSPPVYQIVKDYAYGGYTQRREIYKPIPATIMVADNGVIKTFGADYTLNETLGLVEFTYDPVGPVTWGGEFDVPVRFDSEFPVEILDRRIQSASFTLRELRHIDS